MTNDPMRFEDDTPGDPWGTERDRSPSQPLWDDDDEFATWLETGQAEGAEAPAARPGSVGSLGDAQFDDWLRSRLQDPATAPSQQELIEWLLRRRSSGE